MLGFLHKTRCVGGKCQAMSIFALITRNDKKTRLGGYLSGSTRRAGADSCKLERQACRLYRCEIRSRHGCQYSCYALLHRCLLGGARESLNGPAVAVALLATS